MKHDRSRYYVIGGLSLFITASLSYIISSDRSGPAIIFSALMMAIPLCLFFLFIDYALTVAKKYWLMKFFYLLVILLFAVEQPISRNLPLHGILETIIVLTFAIFIIFVIASFFMHVFTAKDEAQQKDVSHAMHLLADEYQKRKEKQQPWEEQFYEFFEEKLKGFRGKKNSGEDEKATV